jgi:hypothetical protein
LEVWKTTTGWGAPSSKSTLSESLAHPSFKNTRLPVETITDNVDAYMDAGLPLDRAIAETLDSFPSTPGGADGIRAVLDYRAAHEHQFQF